jgi:hypothetical protein
MWRSGRRRCLDRRMVTFPVLIVADGLSSNQESTRNEVPPGTTRTSYLVSGTSLGLQVLVTVAL